MSQSWEFIIREILTGAISTIFTLMKVLIPLMIIVQILLVYGIIEKLAAKLEFLGKAMGMSKEAVFPLLVGVIMGVTYGAGTLMELQKKQPLKKKDFALIGVFMYLCHGIIETGFLFGVAGASIFVVTVIRLLIAFVVTVIVARTPMFKTMGGEVLEDKRSIT